MPNLSCTVTSCTHNKGQMCCLRDIQVSGESAEMPNNTSCDSFAPNSGTNSMTNSMGTEIQNQNVMITCAAEKCRYNDCRKCNAKSVAIDGESGSKMRAQTECSTFECR